MIQFNLLPNVKVEYLRAKKLKVRIAFIASIITGVCIVISAAMFLFVTVQQVIRMELLDETIKSISSDIQSKKDINKVLTIQNQLTELDGLHSTKPSTERLFNILVQITPKSVSIERFDIDFELFTIQISGQAPSLEELNKFIDTLKFTKLQLSNENQESLNAFNTVVLGSYSLNDKGAGFTTSLKYDSRIFDSAEENIRLVVPKITTTRSETERPTDLFKINETPTGEGGDDE